jgi:hypothetical protein
MLFSAATQPCVEEQNAETLVGIKFFRNVGRRCVTQLQVLWILICSVYKLFCLPSLPFRTNCSANCICLGKRNFEKLIAVTNKAPSYNWRLSYRTTEKWPKCIGNQLFYYPNETYKERKKNYIIMCYNNTTNFKKKTHFKQQRENKQVSCFPLFSWLNSRISVLFRRSRMSGFDFGWRSKKSLCGICRSSCARNFVMSIFVEQIVALFSCKNCNWKCEA